MAPPRTRTTPIGFGDPPSKRSKRLRTNGSTLEIAQDDSDDLTENANALRKYVYSQVISRLQQAQAIVSGLSIASLEWMLPDGNIDSWKTFLDCPNTYGRERKGPCCVHM